MKNKYIIGGIIILALGAIFYFMTPKNNADTTPSPESNTPSEQSTGTTAIMSTSMGDITIELNPTDAPKTVENFVKLANEGFYDGTKFHRVIPNFMVQGGDRLTKDDSAVARWGTGGPGYALEDEIHENNRNSVGTISMANSGPNTNGSQFFLNVADNDFLDTKHTVFGTITSGMDVVNAIVNVPTEGADRPVEAVTINSVTIK